jgi:hypothetical protein
LSHFAHGENGMKDLVEETKNYEFSKGSQRSFYKVKSFNRNEEDNISMKLSILFEGEGEPDVLVLAVGLSTRDFNIENSPAYSKIKRDAFIMFIVIIVIFFVFIFILFFSLVSKVTISLDRKGYKRYAKKLFDVMRLDVLHDSMSDDEIKSYLAI